MVVSFFFDFHPYLGKMNPFRRSYFSDGWFNHQPEYHFLKKKKNTQLATYHRRQQGSMYLPCFFSDFFMTSPRNTSSTLTERTPCFSDAGDDFQRSTSRSFFSLLHYAVAGRNHHADSCSMYGSCPLEF